ncbi:MAG TPA: DUF2703 domain-containing protein [Actinobacteria bacterium]|nr:DUF2703 domain-containing protein [Actinomycetota bacterium]
MKVELLYFDGCPSHEKALQILQEVRTEILPDMEIDKINVRDDETARVQKFLGSPSVRINGIDIDPTARESKVYGRKCRIYQTDEGILGWPSKKMIKGAIEEAQK